MIEKLLEKAHGRVDSSEIYSVESSTMEISYEAGKLKTAERKDISGVGLRVINEGKIGFSSSTDPQRLDEVIDNACASSKFGKDVDFGFPGSSDYAEVGIFDPAVEEYSPEKAVREGKTAVDRLLETIPKGLTDVHISASTATVRIANTSGLDVTCRVSDFSHSIVSVIVEGDSILWIGDGGHYGTLDIRTDGYVKKISGLAKKAETKAPRVSGTMPVIFTAQEMPDLIATIEMGVNGKLMLKGESPLIGREGEKVIGSVTLTDDPFINGALASRPFDDEGIPSQKTVLFDNGVFRSFLFDLDTAAKTGRTTTASAERSALSLPSIGTSNLVMSTGTSNLDDMISGMEEGIIVYGVLGGGQSNLLAGDFALNIMLGFLVRNGEIAGRLIDTMVSGNVYSAFNSIDRMSSEATQVGALFVPDIMFSELSLSSS